MDMNPGIRVSHSPVLSQIYHPYGILQQYKTVFYPYIVPSVAVGLSLMLHSFSDEAPKVQPTGTSITSYPDRQLQFLI